MTMDIREKRASEKHPVGFDFAPDLTGTEHFHSATVVCSTGLTAEGLPIIAGNNNTQITQIISGGTAGSYYTVTITGTTDTGNVFEKVFIVRVVSDVAPAAANANTALVRLDEVKGYLGKVTDEDTWLIEQLIDAIGVRFNSYTDRHLITATYTNECYDGTGLETLRLKNYPILANLAVVEDDVALTQGNENDYLSYNTEGQLVRVNKGWYAGNKTIQVTHTSGYNATNGTITLPVEIRLAAMKQIGFEFTRFQKKDWGGDSISYPDGSVTVTQEGLLKDVRQVLDGYRRYTL
jgi:hypothetical protein